MNPRISEPLERIRQFQSNCACCSYGNGLASRMREIVGRNEQYRCPIKHARRVMQAYPYYGGFADFGDAEGYRRELRNLRAELACLGQENAQ
jgi:hypothetical protein